MSDGAETTIPDIRVAIDGLGVTVRSERLLWVLSSAIVGGGFCRVRDIVNMHVDDMPPGTSPERSSSPTLGVSASTDRSSA